MAYEPETTEKRVAELPSFSWNTRKLVVSLHVPSGAITMLSDCKRHCSVAVVNAVKGGATPSELVSANVPITSGLVTGNVKSGSCELEQPINAANNHTSGRRLMVATSRIRGCEGGDSNP